ncbi:type II toxin-antitoxin system VapB family antitoxin [Ferrovibrio sp.]|uniref:type II toxin-antitoxin system VapB family antitoxin n=1 Tax=Ferrovibrio sp. TaxID=1917215 RepID=UPI0025BDAD53|nr:type II toxin-antitoxin system VapB family antitoxin [Ferrovibrio sp.]MBX3454461.1 antitoxin [Ferrovibrio sp.]
MIRSSLFTNNRTQAVRLPKALAFPPEIKQVEIIRLGQSLLLSPVGKRWDDFFASGPRASADFMVERDDERSDAPAEEREPL